MQFLSKSEKDTINLGKQFGEKSKGGEVFLLSGELGGGKTQFVKGLAQGLGVTEPVTSPTFTYEKIYRGKNKTLYHFDLYREEIIDPDIEALLREASADNVGVVAVEWADRLIEKPQNAKEINFNWVSENERKIIIG